MNKKIDLIMSSVQQFCREGYLLPKERKTLYDLAELHGIDKTDLENVLAEELGKVRKGRLENLYKASKQPDAALSSSIEIFQQSRRQFPDILNLGTLRLKLNKDVKVPAFVPIKGMTGFCIVHNNNFEEACNIIQNVVIRLLYSIPRSLAQISIVDPYSMGSDYIGLSGIDSHLLRVIDDDKQVLPFLQSISKESASFNFKGLGNSFEDIAEYNRVNRSKAHPYQLIILSDFQNISDKNILVEIKKINKLASKTGIFFLFSVDTQSLDDQMDLFDIFKVRDDDTPNICIIDTIKKELWSEGSDEIAFFNNAFDFEIDQELLFNADTIQQLNHEYDPNAYPLEQQGVEQGDYSIESLNTIVGKVTDKEKSYTISLQSIHDNIIIVSHDDKKSEAIAESMIQSISSMYKQSEVNYLFYNCNFIPETLSGTNIEVNIHTGKLSYIKALLAYLENIKETRRVLFQEAGVSTYEAYRNMVETPFPRIACFLGDLDALLDSENMNAVESTMLLDTMLNESGQYGIHFLMLSKPSQNLFKLNLTDNVRFKLFGSLIEDEIMSIGIFSSEEEIKHQNQDGACILYNAQQSASVKLDVMPIDKQEWNSILSAFSIDSEKINGPKIFVDLNDIYPVSYKGINANTISEECLDNDIPIGFPREFSTQFATLGHENVMIVGDDPDGVTSILRSVVGTLKRTNRLSSLSVFDALDGHFSDALGIESYSSIDNLPIEKNGILCLLNMEVCDPLSTNSLYTLIEDAKNAHAQVLLFSKNDIYATDLGITSASFATKIALSNAPEGYISPIHFYTNDELRLPTQSMQAVIEQSDSESVVNIKAMWLFNY